MKAQEITLSGMLVAAAFTPLAQANVVTSGTVLDLGAGECEEGAAPCYLIGNGDTDTTDSTPNPTPGPGALAINTGSGVPAGGMQVSPDSVFATNKDVWLGYQETGTATVSGVGAQWTIDADELRLGFRSGGRGEITVDQGGLLDTAGTAATRLAYGSSSASAQITVSGSGSQWLNAGNELYMGNSGGDAELHVLAGGVVTTGTAHVGLSGGASSANKTYRVRVDGSGSRLTLDRKTLMIGDEDGLTGRLEVTNGGVVEIVSTAQEQWFDAMAFGRFDGSTGDGRVSGAGSQLIGGGNNGGTDLCVGGCKSGASEGLPSTGGEFGTGTLTIENGGLVENRNAFIGYTDGQISTQLNGGGASSGTVTVGGTAPGSGERATWITRGDLYLGDAGGDGVVTINDGGTVRVEDNGALSGTQGTLFLRSAGSRLSLHGDGELVAANLVQQNGTVQLGNGTTLDLGGSGTFTQTGGNLTIGNAPGSAMVEGHYDIGGLLEIEIGGTTPGREFDVLEVTGDVTLNVGSTLSITLLDPYTPALGDSYAFLWASAFFGTAFETVIAPVFDIAGLDYTLGVVFDAGGQFAALAVVPATVPLPAPLALLASGLMAVLVLCRRRHGAGRTSAPGWARPS